MSASGSSLTSKLSRRSFFRWTSSVAAAVGAAPLISATESLAAPATPAVGEDYYDKMGVDKIINAAGTYTMYTAACMPPVVLAAVQKAALHPVRLHDLQVKSGVYIAKRINETQAKSAGFVAGTPQMEAALVTSGASGAISLATAACMQYANNIKVLAMPQSVDGMKNQVIVQKAHRYGYDHAMYLCGARVTEVVTADDFKRAADKGTAIMTNFFNAYEDQPGAAGDAQMDREAWLKIAHSYNIPCHIDAAADMPPISNLWKYTSMGFDLVTFSGGKGIRGPQNAGLLLGKKELIDMALLNAPPDDGIGRGMKVAKEQIVGMAAAVDWVLSHTEETMQGDYQKRADLIAHMLKGIPSVTTETVVPKIANHVPHLLIRFDPAVTGITTREIVKALGEEKPAIILNPGTGRRPGQGIPGDANTLVVGVWMLQPGEDAIVGHHIKTLLTKKA
jgi:L-seryl-tRNA(Ser) seleniumtransferase